MELWQKIQEAYPDIDFTALAMADKVILRDDSDGKGAYIEKWDWEKPLPAGLKIGK